MSLYIHWLQTRCKALIMYHLRVQRLNGSIYTNNLQNNMASKRLGKFSTKKYWFRVCICSETYVIFYSKVISKSSDDMSFKAFICCIVYWSCKWFALFWAYIHVQITYHQVVVTLTVSWHVHSQPIPGTRGLSIRWCSTTRHIVLSFVQIKSSGVNQRENKTI